MFPQYPPDYFISLQGQKQCLIYPLSLQEGSLQRTGFKSKFIFSNSLLYFGGLMTTVEANTSLTKQKLPWILVLKASRYIPSQFLQAKPLCTESLFLQCNLHYFRTNQCFKLRFCILPLMALVTEPPIRKTLNLADKW